MGSQKTGNNFKRKLLIAAVVSCFSSEVAWANPTGASVARGSASISTVGSTMTVTNTPKAIINWASFGIAAGETVKFVQQSTRSSVLNRVIGSDPSNILGALQSNGKVFLINPNGIMFGASARVDVNGLVASTLNMSDADFLNDRMRFTADRATPGSVSNAGNINTPTGGFVYIVAPQVENSGVISTPGGEAILAAGHSVELVDSTDPNLRVVVNAPTKDVNLSQIMTQSDGNIYNVLNSGKVSANTAVVGETGRVYLKSAGNIQTTTTSVIEARGDATKDGGHIQAFADQDGLYRGTFDASGRNGGFIETSGHAVDIGGVHVKANAIDPSGKPGTWLLDPADFVIDSSSAYSIEQSIGNYGTDFHVDASNDITVGYSINSANGGPGEGKLWLNAGNDIFVDRSINIAGALDMQAGNNIFIGGGGYPHNQGAYTQIMASQVTANAGGTFGMYAGCPDSCGAPAINAIGSLSTQAMVDIHAKTINLVGYNSGYSNYPVVISAYGINGGIVQLNAKNKVTLNNSTLVASSSNNIAGVSINAPSIDIVNGSYIHAKSDSSTAIAFVDVIGTNISISGSYTQIFADGYFGGGAEVYIDAAGSLSVTGNAEIAALTDYSAPALVDMFADSMLIDGSNVHAGSGYNSYTPSYNGSVLLVAQSMNINNSSISGNYIGLNYEPGFIQTNTAEFANFISTASVNITGSFISSTHGIGFAGNNVTITNSSLTSDLMHGIATSDMKLSGSGEGATLFAYSEMLLEVGGHLYLDNGAAIVVESPSSLYFNFPLLTSDGWLVDGVANLYQGSNGSFLQVAGADPILGSNFFVTYGGSVSGSGNILSETEGVLNPILDPENPWLGELMDMNHDEEEDKDKPQQCNA
jgi:filamentous hemagglutinin family protein